MFRILKKSLKTGVVTGQHPEAREPSKPPQPEAREKALPFRQSLTIREVDTGSCNACEMEMNALANPIYDIERFGVHIAASPRHADALVVRRDAARFLAVSLRVASGRARQTLTSVPIEE